MTKTQLELETVTPMFLHGYNNNQPELRPPPFKALFRYWWRTVQACKANSLRDKEAKLFGSTKCKAPFSIRISGTTKLNSSRYKPLPHRSGSRVFTRDAYNGGQSFDLYLITKNGLGVYRQIAKLGFLLGGVGNRSRRGFGSIREKDWNFKNIFDLRNEILETLNAVAGVTRFCISGPTIKSTLTSFPKYPVIQGIYFGKPTSDVARLLQKIGQATHKHNNDALGYANRLASPIHVRIQKVGDKYVPVVTQLHSVFPKAPPRQYLMKQEKFIDAIIG